MCGFYLLRKPKFIHEENDANQNLSQRNLSNEATCIDCNSIINGGVEFFNKRFKMLKRNQPSFYLKDLNLMNQHLLVKDRRSANKTSHQKSIHALTKKQKINFDGSRPFSPDTI